MAEAGVTNIKCGFCLRNGDAVKDPKALPCTHIHCLSCLLNSFSVNRIVQCPLCREAFDVAVDSLPSSNTREDTSTCCDVCIRKGVDNQPAVTYCTSCSAKYCPEHKKTHDEFVGTHSMVMIEEYKLRARKLQLRFCTEHSGVAYSLGCRVCMIVVCYNCTTELGLCKEGGAHTLITLDVLVDELTTEIDEMRAEVTDREDKLSALFKQMSRIISDYDIETKAMTQRLRKACDEQVEAIQQKYKKLEEEFLTLRRNVKTELSRFMEENIGVKWSDIATHRLAIDARLKHNHKVDIISGYEETTDEIWRLISDKLPTLELQNMVTLEFKGQCIADRRRDAEVEVVYPTIGFLDFEHGLTTADPIPKCMTLVKTVMVSSECRAVCQYKDITYVGLYNNTVVNIDQNYQLSQLLTLSGEVFSVTVYKDRIYTLVYENPYRVNVHQLSGQLITSWTFIELRQPWYYSYVSKLVILDDQIIIPDRTNKRLTIYSLTGEVIKHVPCLLLSEDKVALHSSDTNSVVVSDYASSKVFKVNISTGEIIWKFTHVPNPEGVTCCRGKVFVTNANESTTIRIWILNEETGDLLAELTDPASRPKSHVFDLHVSGKTLIVPIYDERQVLFYELNLTSAEY